MAGKQPLFNLHRANLRGCSIHQGQLPAHSAGGYLPSRALRSLRHRPLALVWIRVLAARQHKRPQSGARTWVVWLFDTGQPGPGSRCSDVAKGCWFQISRLKQMTSWSPTPMSLCQGRQSCWKRRATASLVWSVGSVCVSCFVIPANWPSLHPTLPYQGTARGGKQTIVADGTLW